MKNYHYLASNNTCEGFRNQFKNIQIGDDNFTYIIKGSSGSGKSTFMKNIAKAFEQKGYTIEYFHCSSDATSLDGIRIVEKNISFVDGTAPHITDPTLPQVKEKILNVVDYISPLIKLHRDKLTSLAFEKSKKFAVLYGYLKSVGELIKAEQLQSLHDENEVNDKVKTIAKSLKLKMSKDGYVERSLFITYVDKGGINFLENDIKNVINLDMTNYFDGFEVNKKLAEMLKEKNIQHIKLLSPLFSDYIEGILLPKKDLLIYNNHTDKNKFHNQKIIDNLLLRCGSTLCEARSLHKKIEKYYIQNMDFNKLNSLQEEVIEEIGFNKK